MDLSCIISDIVQSAITKGAKSVTISIFSDSDTLVRIECEGFEFPHLSDDMRSLGYEYILRGKHRISENFIEFVSDYPFGKIESFCVNILSSNPKLDEFRLIFTKNDNEYVFSRNETLVTLGDVYIGEYNVLNWIEEEIRTKIEAL